MASNTEIGNGRRRPIVAAEDPETEVMAPDSSTDYHQLVSVEPNHNEIPRSDAFTINARLRAYLSSHNGKELLACVVLGSITFAITFASTTKPHQRKIPFQYLEDNGEYIRNLSNNEEAQESTVPTWQLVILCLVLCPLLQFTLGSLYGLAGDVHSTLCVYCLAIPVNNLATFCVKLYVGYLRPNFYSQCQPSDDYEYCTTADDQVDYYGWDLRQSFPSGHASWSFCCLTLVWLYLERCFGLSSIQYYDYAYVTMPTVTAASAAAAASNSSDAVNTTTTTKRLVIKHHHNQNIFRYRLGSILSLAPLVLAIFIATSRVVDNKHFPADIVAGSILGSSVARFFHHLWFIDPGFCEQ